METNNPKKKLISTKVQLLIAILIVITLVIVVNINKNRDKLANTSQTQVASEPVATPALSPEEYKANILKQNEAWLTDASKRYFNNHKEEFTDITMQKAREAMELCVLDKTMSKEQCEGIIEKKFWQGMTKNWTYLSMGAPNRKNTTVVGNTQQEQWVYGATYLYFKDDILTSYQKSE